jgi:hypothetical protein
VVGCSEGARVVKVAEAAGNHQADAVIEHGISLGTEAVDLSGEE